MRDGFKTTKLMESEDLFMPMVMYITDTGSMIKHMEQVSIAIWMEPSMKVTGRKINSTEKVLKHGQMVLDMTVSMSLVKSMESENSHGLMEALTMEISKKIISKETENITGQMAEYLKAPGSTIKWKDKVSSHGLMVEGMREIIKMIRKRAMVHFIGPMVENMMEVGKMENNMVWEPTPQLVANPNRENGKKAKGSTGSLAMAPSNDS